ncbi:putative palmitoyltransferase ZDHHC23-like [Tropilaelaps mercedesae]|uniref:Putative palmitoyltransferase ZDHHC23-like n=1 Tax=Tropilaelaps mercedesae TaxID=418985 RepID=A0A1V9XXG2_9ACAR|nr:putative palmitoyltransferase ZDHHC23-like [Tropilaelaps mercedesae]
MVCRGSCPIFVKHIERDNLRAQLNSRLSHKIPVFIRPSPYCTTSSLVDGHVCLALLSFPLLFIVACQGWWSMWASLVAMFLFLRIVHDYCHRKRLRSRFFLVWGILSYLQLLLLFQLVIVSQLKVLFSENAILTVLVLAALYCAYRTRSDPGVLNPHRSEEEVRYFKR